MKKVKNTVIECLILIFYFKIYLSKSLITEKNSAMWDLIGVPSCMQRRKTLLQNQPIHQLFQIVVLKSLSQRGCYFLRRKLIQHLVCQAKLNSRQDFLIQLMSSFFFHVLRLFLPPSSVFFNPLWVRMTFILIRHLLKLMTLSNFWISNLIADIFTLTLLWYQLLWNRRLHDQSLGRHSGSNTELTSNEKKRKEDILKYRSQHTI